MGSKANSTIINNSAIVRYEPARAWVGYTTEIEKASVSLDFYGTDITAYGTGYPYTYQIYLDDKLIPNYVQRHFENSEVAEYYHCKHENPTEGFCVVLVELHDLDPTRRHTIRITSILGGSEFIKVLQWLVQYDTAMDKLAASPRQIDLGPSERSIEYTGSWSTLVSGDKVTRTTGDKSKFTFTGSGIEIFGVATKGNRLCIDLDGEAQEIVPTNSRSGEILAYTLPSLYSRLGLNQDIPHTLTITNLIDSSIASPLVNVTIKRIAIWKDDGVPQYVNTTHKLAYSNGSGTATGASTFTMTGMSTPSPSGTVTVSTATSIAVKCITFILIFVIIWLLLRSWRRRHSAGLTTKGAADANIREMESNHQLPPNSFLPGVCNRGVNVSSQTIAWTIPPSIPDWRGATRTLPVARSATGESSHTPCISHHDMAREILAEQKQEIGPLSPSTLQDTEDSQSVDEERVNRVILEVARRMGGVERTGLPPDYADL